MEHTDVHAEYGRDVPVHIPLRQVLTPEAINHHSCTYIHTVRIDTTRAPEIHYA